MSPAGGSTAQTFVDSFVTGVVELKKRPSFLRRAVDRLPRWMTPNMVTVFRTCLAAPIVWSALNGHYAAALVIFAAAMILDFVDGALAEIRNVKTAFGAFLDPLSDKILVCGTLLALIPVLHAIFIPFICGACMIAVALTAIRVAKMRRGRPNINTFAAKPAGKLKCIVESTAVGLMLMGLGLALPALIWAGGALLASSLILAGLSLWSQVWPPA